METTIINFKTDKAVKEKARKIAGEMGLNLSDVMNVCLRDFVRTKELNIKIEELNEETKKEIRSALKEKRTSPLFEDPAEAIRWLNKESKKYAD